MKITVKAKVTDDSKNKLGKIESEFQNYQVYLQSGCTEIVNLYCVTKQRQEYVKCGDPDCEKSHGPYLYAYWKQDKKLKKRYVGKNLEDFVRTALGGCKVTKTSVVQPSNRPKTQIENMTYKHTHG